MAEASEKGLQIKSLYTVLKDLIDWTTARTDKLTDFNVGSGIRTLYEAVAVQLEEFYFRMKQNVLYAIEMSIYTAFSMPRLSAEYATGQVSVSFLRPLTNTLIIPKGTLFVTGDSHGYVHFEAIEDTYCAPGLVTTFVTVRCQKPGIIGNIPLGAISIMIPDNQWIRSVTNTAVFTNGREAETAAEHKKRFQRYINTLSKATRNAITYGALQVDGVVGAWVDDEYIGYVKLYVHDSNGELPAELRAAVNAAMVEYRAAGIEVEVLPVLQVSINPTILVMLYDQYDTEIYQPQVQSIVTAFFNDYSVGENFYVADLIHHIKSCYEGIVLNVTVNNAVDYNVEPNQRIHAGTVTIRCINKKDWGDA